MYTGSLLDRAEEHDKIHNKNVLGSGANGPGYVMGRSEAETRRLEAQARLYDRATRPVLEDAGLSAGMVVLDVGCGAGDVAMIAAALVRPGGRVVAVDVNPDVLERARSRADQAGHRNIDFVQGDVRDLAGDHIFDAVIGRLVLLHQTDPAAALAAICRRLRPGGVVAFCELDSRYVVHTHPPVELYSRAMGWICETLQRAGFDTTVGGRLHQIFLAAGLPPPTLIASAPIGGAPDWPGFAHVAETLRSVMPFALRFGVATEDEIGIDTLGRAVAGRGHQPQRCGQPPRSCRRLDDQAASGAASEWARPGGVVRELRKGKTT